MEQNLSKVISTNNKNVHPCKTVLEFHLRKGIDEVSHVHTSNDLDDVEIIKEGLINENGRPSQNNDLDFPSISIMGESPMKNKLLKEAYYGKKDL